MFKIVYEGVEIHCETPDDAIELISKLRGSAPLPRKGKSGGTIIGSRWTVPKFEKFLSLLHNKQRKFLQELIRNPTGVTDIALRQALTLKTNKGLGPILTAISRRAKKVGLTLSEIYASEKLNEGKDRVLEFRPSAAFLRVVEEAGGMK